MSCKHCAPSKAKDKIMTMTNGTKKVKVGVCANCDNMFLISGDVEDGQ